MDLDAIKKEYENVQNQSGDRIDYDKIYWKAPIGESVIRIVPSMYTPENPFTRLRFHYGIGNKTMISPLNWGEKDPIYDFSQKLLDQEYEKEKFKLAKKLEGKMRIFVPVIVRGEEDKGVRLWQFSPTIYQEFLSYAMDEEVGDYTDPVNGHDFKVTVLDKETTGKSFNETKIQLKISKTPLTKDKEQFELWTTEQPNPTELHKRYSYDEMKAALREMFSGSTQDEAEEVPATPKAPENKKGNNYSLESNKKPSKAKEYESLFESDSSNEKDDLPFD